MRCKGRFVRGDIEQFSSPRAAVRRRGYLPQSRAGDASLRSA